MILVAHVLNQKNKLRTSFQDVDNLILLEYPSDSLKAFDEI